MTCWKCKKDSHRTYQYGWCKDCIVADLSKLKYLLDVRNVSKIIEQNRSLENGTKIN